MDFVKKQITGLIAWLIYRRRINQLFSREAYASASRLIDFLLKLDPFHPEYLTWRAVVRYHQGAFTKAYEDFYRAIIEAQGRNSSKHVFAEIYTWRGAMFNRSGHYADALIDLNRAVQLDPASPMAYFHRSTSHFYLNDYPACERDLTTVLSFNHLEPKLRINSITRQATIRPALDPTPAVFDYEIQMLNEQLKAGLYTSEIYAALGQLHFQTNHFNHAIEAINHAIEQDPEHANHYNMRGSIFMHMRDYPAAVADYRKALELASDHAVYLNNLGYGLLLQGNIEDAAPLIEKSIERNPQLAYAFGSRGHMRFLGGNYKNALADFRHGRELNRDQLSRHYCTAGEAITLYQTGQIEDARALWLSLRQEAAAFRTIEDFDIQNVWAEPCMQLAHQLIAETVS